MASESYSAFDGRDDESRPKLKRPYAHDWQTINDKGVEYSAERREYWFKGKGYDQLSAEHNGLVGIGSSLSAMIRTSGEQSEGPCF